MLYKGYFKTNKEESILVEIITGNSTENDSITTDLVFSGESPVIISTESDGLFSPIKSRSCTVTLVAEQPYYDMYSGTSHGTKLHVYNCDTAECLFWGYVTPCAYSQPYNYLNTIEIEAVDALSTLQDYQYKMECRQKKRCRKHSDEYSIYDTKCFICLYTGSFCWQLSCKSNYSRAWLVSF